MKRALRIGMAQTGFVRVAVCLLAAGGLVMAQDQTPQNPAPEDQTPHAWRSVNDGLPADLAQAGQPAPAPTVNGAADPGQAAQVQNAPGQPPAVQASPAQPPYNQPPYNQAPYNAQQYPGPGQAGAQNYPPPPANYVPAKLTVKAGTYVSVRINQWLSSDRNQKGDTFTATLDQPLVVDGFVVAGRGQLVYGRVTEAQKAGRVEGTSRLGLELTQLTLVDGNQVSVLSQMISQRGPTSNGRDAAAIGGTTALGAVIGAGVGWGRGAAIGAGAGAAAGIIGVLLTRGRPTVIYPESVLTFQLQQPVEIATDKSPQAFQYVSPQDYGSGAGQGPNISRGPVPPPAPGYGYGAAYPGYYPYPNPYYAYGYPYPYYGLGVYIGPGFYGRGFYRGGFYRR